MGVLLGLAAVVLVPTFGVWWLRGSPIAAVLALGPAIAGSVALMETCEHGYIQFAMRFGGGSLPCVVLILGGIVLQGVFIAGAPMGVWQIQRELDAEYAARKLDVTLRRH